MFQISSLFGKNFLLAKTAQEERSLGMDTTVQNFGSVFC